MSLRTVGTPRRQGFGLKSHILHKTSISLQYSKNSARPGGLMDLCSHRRRIYTEEKAKVVAVVWGTELIQFLAAPAILHQDDLKNRTNSSFSSYHPGAEKLLRGKELNAFCSPNSSDDLCLLLCINTSSMFAVHYCTALQCVWSDCIMMILHSGQMVQ